MRKITRKKSKVYKPIMPFFPVMKKRNTLKEYAVLGKSAGKRAANTILKRRTASDFSNRAVLIVLLALVIVTIISIGFYLQTLNTIKPKIVVNEGKAVGEVSIVILPPPELAAGVGGQDYRAPSAQPSKAPKK